MAVSLASAGLVACAGWGVFQQPARCPCGPVAAPLAVRNRHLHRARTGFGPQAGLIPPDGQSGL